MTREDPILLSNTKIWILLSDPRAVIIINVKHAHKYRRNCLTKSPPQFRFSKLGFKTHSCHEFKHRFHSVYLWVLKNFSKENKDLFHNFSSLKIFERKVLLEMWKIWILLSTISWVAFQQFQFNLIERVALKSYLGSDNVDHSFGQIHFFSNFLLTRPCCDCCS